MKVVLLTNILNPFRIYFYDKLYDEFVKTGSEFKVLVMIDEIPGRKWKYENFKRGYTKLLNGKNTNILGVDSIKSTGVDRVIMAERPDVMVCAGSYLLPAVWTALRLRKKVGYKILLWSESHLKELRDYSSWKIKLRNFLRRIIFKKFDAFWYAGQMAREFIEVYARSDAQYIFVPNIVDENAYNQAFIMEKEDRQKLRDKYEIPEEELVAVCPARLSKVKGIPQFLELLSEVPEDRRNHFSIVIPGFGEMEDEIRQTAKEKNIKLKLVGFKQQDEMIELYALADFLLLPSLSDPNPLSCIEAAWAGKPLLVSEHVGNNPELVIPEQNGYVFTYTNKEESIKMIDMMLNKPRAWYAQGGGNFAQHCG